MHSRLVQGLPFLIPAILLAMAATAQHKRDLMQDAHALVFDHSTISRSVEVLPNGVRTTTTTTDAALLPILQKHPREMGQLYQQGGMVRGWDPLFAELAAVHEKVSMTVRDIEGGVEVSSTSEDPEVVKLIQAHARKVSEMAQRGVPAMQEATPLPDGYVRPGTDKAPAAPATDKKAAADESTPVASDPAPRCCAGGQRCCFQK